MDEIVLGIDPSLTITGFAVLTHKNYAPKVLDVGFVALHKLKDLNAKLALFEEFLLQKLMQFNINRLCVETPFLGKNAQTFLKLGYLRGILLLTAHKHTIPLSHFAPRSVKQAVTGYGGASKEQVAQALGSLFPQLRQFTKTTVNDVTDAMAIALCGILNLHCAVKAQTLG